MDLYQFTDPWLRPNLDYDEDFMPALDLDIQATLALFDPTIYSGPTTGWLSSSIEGTSLLEPSLDIDNLYFESPDAALWSDFSMDYQPLPYHEISMASISPSDFAQTSPQCDFNSVSSPTSSPATQPSPLWWEAQLTTPFVTELPLEIFGTELVQWQSAEQIVNTMLPLHGDAAPKRGSSHEASRPESASRTRLGYNNRRKRAGNLRLTARDIRKINLPAKCHYCGKGHDYPAALRRHIATNHREKLQAPRPRFTCQVSGCGHSYARSDHLFRHGEAKHGWKSSRKKRVQNGGQ